MLISENKKYIFIHNQKAAGVSMKNYLFDNVADTEYLLPNHAYASDGIQKVGLDNWEKYYTFGFVRNPWERLVSWYVMVTKGSESEGSQTKNEWTPNNDLWKYVDENSSNFEEFILNCTDNIVENREGFLYKKSFTRNQLDYFTDDSGNIAVDFIGRFENLQTDFEKVLEHLNFPKSELSWTNKTNRSDFREYYTRETREIVAERFSKDIKHFGYTFD